MEEDADAGNTLLGDELPLLDTKTVPIEIGYKSSTKSTEKATAAIPAPHMNVEGGKTVEEPLPRPVVSTLPQDEKGAVHKARAAASVIQSEEMEHVSHGENDQKVSKGSANGADDSSGKKRRMGSGTGTNKRHKWEELATKALPQLPMDTSLVVIWFTVT